MGGSGPIWGRCSPLMGHRPHLGSLSPTYGALPTPQPCPDDSLTPLRLAVNFSLDPTSDPTNGPTDPKPVLDPTATSTWIEVGKGGGGRCGGFIGVIGWIWGILGGL